MPAEAANTKSLKPRRRAAIVGCGRMGLVHAERLIADGRAEIVALSDQSLTSAERLRDQYAAGAVIVPDAAALLSQTTPEVVLICTPTAAHFEQVALCCSRGLQV